MLTKSILTAAAIALVVGIGSASAGEQFSTLDAISADVMSPAEMSTVQGSNAEVYLVMRDMPTSQAYLASMLDINETGLGAASVMVSITDTPLLLVAVSPPMPGR